ncbi:hypothetical protein EVAR_37970_1 [Eumeta japonica]|uniref:Uncharacterized protein n=1 Tax=Eumeta variegata TaxID=151549 RepID=A0A4C1YZC2_EUMVA|nr:hypothetical protein EVAR_37970_1 [Eumeta japonica]
MECFPIPVTDNKARKHLLQPEKWKRNLAKTVRWLWAKQEQYVIGDVFKVANGSTKTRKMSGSYLPVARGVIATVYQRMKFEAENGVERVTDARWRTSKAVGVSERTVTRILKQNEKVIQLARC